jgi:hypothetical protein
MGKPSRVEVSPENQSECLFENQYNWFKREDIFENRYRYGWRRLWVGLRKKEEISCQKADLLYWTIDGSGFYRTTVTYLPGLYTFPKGGIVEIPFLHRGIEGDFL